MAPKGAGSGNQYRGVWTAIVRGVQSGVIDHRLDPARERDLAGVHPVALRGRSNENAPEAGPDRRRWSCASLGGVARADIPPTLVGLSYQFSIPIGETYNYIPQVSWRGIGLDIGDLRPGGPRGRAWRSGGTSSREHHLDAPPTRERDVTGNQDRALNFWPTLVNVRWFPKISSNRDTQPYIGLNVGGYITERYLAIGLTAAQATHYHFGLAPEIGVFFQNPMGAVFVNARYNMAFSAGGVPFQQFLSFNLGYAWSRGGPNQSSYY